MQEKHIEPTSVVSYIVTVTYVDTVGISHHAITHVDIFNPLDLVPALQAALDISTNNMRTVVSMDIELDYLSHDYGIAEQELTKMRQAAMTALRLSFQTRDDFGTLRMWKAFKEFLLIHQERTVSVLYGLAKSRFNPIGDPKKLEQFRNTSFKELKDLAQHHLFGGDIFWLEAEKAIKEHDELILDIFAYKLVEYAKSQEK